MNKTLHIFSGIFRSSDEAFLYSQEHWEEEPDEDCSQLEYDAWEQRNPSLRYI